MKKKILLLMAACAVLALFLSAVFLYNKLFDKDLQKLQKQQDQQIATQVYAPPTTTAPPPPTTKPGYEMSDFTLTDEDGNTVSLSDLKGKPMVILFWASWNIDSTASIAHLEALKQEQGDNMHVLLINLADGEKETAETAKAWLADKDYTCPVYFDDGTVAAKFNVQELPLTFFLNADGVAKFYINATIRQSDLDDGLAEILPKPE